MRRRRKWLLIPALLALLMAGVTLAAYVRGTWADTGRRVPAGAADEPVCYIRQDAEGRKEACCAVRLSAPMDEVWEAITDYEHFGDICQCLRADRIDHDPAGDCSLKARARSVPPGEMPFAVVMRHEQHLGRYVASWDQPDGDILVNRGRWVLTPLGSDETLLEVSLEVQIRRVPTFILRNISLGRLRDAAVAVERRLREGPSGRAW